MVVTNLTSYDIFVGGKSSYPLVVTLDLWEQITYILPIKMKNTTQPQDFATSKVYSFLQKQDFYTSFF
jgi:hypothetical protein